jgi:predicted nuclease of predicted toxin-antitoxin system
VREQGLLGTNDEALYDHCIDEASILVSLDRDFSNVLHYPPQATSGIVVLRGPNDLFSTMRFLVETLAEALINDQPIGKLWIVEPGRLRVHEPTEPWGEEDDPGGA